MGENPKVCPPIIALGKKNLYLHAAETVEEAVSHARGRFGYSADLNNLVDFFDATGRRLEPHGGPSRSKALPVTDSTDHSEEVRGQIRSIIAKKTQALEELVSDLDEFKPLDELAETLAVVLQEPVGTTAGNNRGSLLHNFFCH